MLRDKVFELIFDNYAYYFIHKFMFDNDRDFKNDLLQIFIIQLIKKKHKQKKKRHIFLTKFSLSFQRSG